MWIAGFVRVYTSISPEQIEVAGDHFDPADRPRAGPGPSSQDGLCNPVVQQDLVQQVCNVESPDFSGVRQQQEVPAHARLGNGYRYQGRNKIRVVMKDQRILCRTLARKAA